MKRTAKINVNVITGFLGAGKTTFINSILEKNPEIQFALVENEFGDVSIDTKLIKGVDISQMFELKQGCICCSIADEYELVLAELAERFPNVQHLLIETTGIADPASVIRPFFRDENLKELYKFNGTVCLVDALNFENQPEKETTLKQIIIADLVLINKSEKLTPAQKMSLKENINQLNPTCEILFAEYGNSVEFRLDNIGFQPKYFLDLFDSKNAHAQINTKTISFSNPLNKENFTDRISYLLDIYTKEIYRVKGILCFENEPYQFILQGVGGSFEISEGENLNAENKSEVVFIGKLSDIEFEINLIT